MNYDVETEQDVIIDLNDGKKIHGILRGEMTPSSRVVVIMHGFPGTPKNLLPYLGSRFIADSGYTTLSLYMYDVGSQYRDAYDCTLDTHVEDFEKVVACLQTLNVAKVFAVGHSFGGLTILKSDVRLDGAVLWDPSHGSVWQDDDAKRDWNIENDQFVISTQGRGSMRPTRLQRSLEMLGDTSSYAKNMSCPTKIITGNKSVIYPFVPKYIEYLSVAKELVVIDGAGHGFDEQDAITMRLFDETVAWLNEQ